MANLALAFNLSASATGMAQGINAGVVELQKLGYAAKQTARDVSTLKTLEISKVFVSAIQSVASSFTQFTSGAAAAVDRTRQLAQNLGVSYGELRRLQVAADLSGASTDELAKAFTRAQLKKVFDALRELVTPPDPPKRPIGFVTPEDKGKRTSGAKGKT